MLHSRHLSQRFIGICVLLVILTSSRTRVVADDIVCGIPDSITLEGSGTASGQTITGAKLTVTIDEGKIKFTRNVLHNNIDVADVKIVFEGKGTLRKNDTNATSDEIKEEYSDKMTGKLEFRKEWPDAAGKVDAPTIKSCEVTSTLTWKNGTDDKDLQDKIQKAVEKEYKSCVKETICAKMCFNTVEEETKKKNKKAMETVAPKLTEWLFRAIVKDLYYKQTTFTFELPKPDASHVNEFFSFDKINCTLVFSEGTLNITTSLINMYENETDPQPFKKSKNLTYELYMKFQIDDFHLVYDDWQFGTPEDISKGPIEMHIENAALIGKFTVTWDIDPPSIKIDEFTVEKPSSTHMELPGTDKMSEDQKKEIQENFADAAEIFFTEHLHPALRMMVERSTEKMNLGLFTPALKGTLDLEKLEE